MPELLAKRVSSMCLFFWEFSNKLEKTLKTENSYHRKKTETNFSFASVLTILAFLCYNTV